MKLIILISSIVCSLYAAGQNTAKKRIGCNARIAGFYEAELQTRIKNVNSKKEAFLNIGFGYAYQKLTGLYFTFMDQDSSSLKAADIISLEIHLSNKKSIRLSEKQFTIPQCYNYAYDPSGKKNYLQSFISISFMLDSVDLIKLVTYGIRSLSFTNHQKKLIGKYDLDDPLSDHKMKFYQRISAYVINPKDIPNEM